MYKIGCEVYIPFDLLKKTGQLNHKITWMNTQLPTQMNIYSA